MLKFSFLSLLFFFEVAIADDNRFLTLRYDKVNLRLGPSKDYPIKIIYKKKYLPVLIKEKSDNFRKVQDHEKNSGWVHISQLSKKKSGITIQDTILYKRSTMYSKPLAKIETGRLLLISKCKDEWCKAKTGDYKGWVKKESLWGLL